jgi:hypothetical protein
MKNEGTRDLVQSHALWCTRSAPGPETHAPPQGVSGQNVLGSMTSRAQDEDCRFVESAADAFPWFPPPGCPFKMELSSTRRGTRLPCFVASV